MVILKFNNLIRNKWVWGVFALAVSAVFVLPDGCIYGSSSRDIAESNNALPKIEFDQEHQELFKKCSELVRSDILSLASLPSRMRPVNLSAFFDKSAESTWKLYAAMEAFNNAGIIVTDEMLSKQIQAVFADQTTGAFDPVRYKDFVEKRFRISLHRFEEYYRMAMTLQLGLQAIENSRVISSNLERESDCRDMSDKFTVRVAKFDEDKKAAAKIVVTDDMIAKWYTNNVQSLELPERYKLRYVKISLSDSKLLANVQIKDEEIEARYKQDCDDGEYVGTNGVVKPLTEVRASILAKLQNEAVKEMIDKAVYDALAANEKNPKFIDEYASSKGLKVQEKWFSFADNAKMDKSLQNDFVRNGFLANVALEFPGVNNVELKNKVLDLEYDDSDVKIKDVKSSNSIWLFALDAKTPKAAANIPDLATVKAIVKPRALAEAKAVEFKKTVDAVKAKGYDEVMKSSGAATNVVVQLSTFDASKAPFANYQQILPEIKKLKKGEVSDFILLSQGKAALVACVDRVAGSEAEYAQAMQNVIAQESYMREITAPSYLIEWLDSNLKSFGYKGEYSSDESSEEEAVTE